MIERYTKIKEIRCGGYGSVWQGYDRFNRRNVAIKYLIENTDENHHLFQREINELLKDDILNNPHIINIIDYNLTDWQPFYVMEFCDGGSLREQIGKVSLDQILAIMKSMLCALKPIHKNNGYHGDFKPDNILIAKNDNQGVIKLADFGLAHTPNLGSTMTWTPRGTDPYKAPEVRQKLFYSSKADIYSFGITIFELLTGEPKIPYLISSPGPRKLINLLRQMTAENPNFRPDLQQIEIQIREIESDSKSTGISAFFSSLSYPEVLVGGSALALLLVSLFPNGENA